MAMILGAWVVDWGYVQKWNSVGDQIKTVLESVQTGYAYRDLVNMYQFEMSVDRALFGRTDFSESSLELYSAAWSHSPEVREKWLSRTQDTAKFLGTMVTQIRTVEHNYGLPPNSDRAVPRLKRINSNLQRIEFYLREERDRNQDLSFSSPYALAWRDTIIVAFGEVVKLVNFTELEVHKKTRQRSRLHRIVFAIGSILLITGKFLARRVDTPVGKQRNNVFGNSSYKRLAVMHRMRGR